MLCSVLIGSLVQLLPHTHTYTITVGLLGVRFLTGPSGFKAQSPDDNFSHNRISTVSNSTTTSSF